MGAAGRNAEQLDDTAILRIASDRADPLLRVVGRTGALQPLIAVLAVLPALIVVLRSGVSDTGSVWALRAIAVLESETATEFLAPGNSGSTRSLGLQPPLASWLTAGVLRVVGAQRSQAVLLVSLLAAAACVWWAYRVFQHLLGPRGGFWAAVLTATHGSVYAIAGSPSPTALSLALVLVAFNAWLRNFQKRDAVVTVPLLTAGVALGFNVLAGGPVALACAGVFVLHPAIDRLLNRTGRVRRGEPPLSQHALATAVVLLTAFAVSGWWLMQAGATTPSFWNNQLAGYTLVSQSSGTTVGTVEATWASVAARWLVVVGPLVPLCAFGLWRVFRPLRRRSTDTENQSSETASNAFLLSWLIVGIGFQSFAGWLGPSAGAERTPTEVFLLLPAIGLAAICLDAFLQRAAAVPTIVCLSLSVVALTPAALWVLAATPIQELEIRIEAAQEALANASTVVETENLEHEIRKLNEEQRKLLLQEPPFDLMRAAIRLLPIVVGTALILWWCLSRWISQPEMQSRIVVVVALAAALSAEFVAGFLSVATAPYDEQRLESLRVKLPVSDVTGMILVSDAEVPPRLEFALRSLNIGGDWTVLDTRRDAAREVLAKTDTQARILVFEWISVGKPTTIIDLRGRKLASIDSPRFYRGRDLRAYLMTPATP